MKNLILNTFIITGATISSCNAADINKNSISNNLSEAQYYSVDVTSKKSEELYSLLNIEYGDMLIAITKDGAKIFKLKNSYETRSYEKSSKKTKVKSAGIKKPDKTTKYEFYSNLYLAQGTNQTLDDQSQYFHIPGDEYCHYWRIGNGYGWVPKGCPK